MYMLSTELYLNLKTIKLRLKYIVQNDYSITTVLFNYID